MRTLSSLCGANGSFCRIIQSNKIDGGVTGVLRLSSVRELSRQIEERKQCFVGFLAQHRGDNETLGSVNNGNFLGILELIAQFDQLMESHLQLLYGHLGLPLMKFAGP